MCFVIISTDRDMNINCFVITSSDRGKRRNLFCYDFVSKTRTYMYFVTVSREYFNMAVSKLL